MRLKENIHVKIKKLQREGKNTSWNEKWNEMIKIVKAITHKTIVQLWFIREKMIKNRKMYCIKTIHKEVTCLKYESKV